MLHKGPISIKKREQWISQEIKKEKKRSRTEKNCQSKYPVSQSLLFKNCDCQTNFNRKLLQSLKTQNIQICQCIIEFD